MLLKKVVPDEARIEAAICIAELEYAKTGVTYEAREALSALRNKHFPTSSVMKE